MKAQTLLGLTLLLAFGATALYVHAQDARHPHGHHNPQAKSAEDGKKEFIAKHVQKKATIILRGDLDAVWPLFDPINEGKWVNGWNPEILHPKDRGVQEGMVFRIHGTIWVVTGYDTRNRHITYTVNHPEKVFTVDVRCAKHGEAFTDATITYNYVALSEAGNKLVVEAAEKMFAHGLKDWQMLINHYLKTGEALPSAHHGDGQHGKGHDGPDGARQG